MWKLFALLVVVSQQQNYDYLKDVKRVASIVRAMETFTFFELSIDKDCETHELQS